MSYLHKTLQKLTVMKGNMFFDINILLMYVLCLMLDNSQL